MTSTRRYLGLPLGMAIASCAFAAPSAAATLGMVAGRDSPTMGSVTVFDADADVTLVTLPLPGVIRTVGDCSISPDGARGFVTDFTGRIHVVDLTTSPPSLAAGPNPIPISNPGEDTSITPDGRFLVVCDGGVAARVSVVDIAQQKEVHTFSLGTGVSCNSVDVCSNGSVLVTSISGTVRRLEIDAAGNLMDTGESALVDRPNNVFCGRGGNSAVVITRNDFQLPDEGQILSFRIPGLVRVDDRRLSGARPFGISGLVAGPGNRIFTRDNDGLAATTGFLEAFAYNSCTGAIKKSIFSTPIQAAPTSFGIDQMALHPKGKKLYVSQPSALSVYDAKKGGLLMNIPLSMPIPTGVCLPPSVQADEDEDCDTED